MIDYAQIEAQAAEMARQFWEEIEEELVRQNSSLAAAAPINWGDGVGLAASAEASDAFISQPSMNG